MVCYIIIIYRTYIRHAIIQCRLLFCVHNSTFQHAKMTHDELGGASRPSQPSTFRIHNVSTLSLFNVKWMPHAPLPRAHGRFAIQLATSMDVTSMEATRCSESSWDREVRLWRRRECERARRAVETAEQRAHRLWQRRERDRARRALQSSERR